MISANHDGRQHVSTEPKASSLHCWPTWPCWNHLGCPMRRWGRSLWEFLALGELEAMAHFVPWFHYSKRWFCIAMAILGELTPHCSPAHWKLTQFWRKWFHIDFACPKKKRKIQRLNSWRSMIRMLRWTTLHACSMSGCERTPQPPATFFFIIGIFHTLCYDFQSLHNCG